MALTISAEQKDQLREVVNIGAGNASTALSQLVNKKISVKVPDVYIDKIESVFSFVGKPEEIMTVILIKLLGDAKGIMMLMFPPDNAIKLAGLLTKTPKENVKILDAIDRSALKEVGNILSGAALTALANLTGLNTVPSIPDAATDMVGSMVDNILAEMGQESEQVLIFKVNFSVEEEGIDGQLFFLFDPGTTQKIVDALNKIKG